MTPTGLCLAYAAQPPCHMPCSLSPIVRPTPEQLAEGHESAHLAILFFGGPIMPQDRKEFHDPSTEHHPRPFHRRPGQPYQGLARGCTLPLRTALAARHYVGEQSESMTWPSFRASHQQCQDLTSSH